MSIRISFSAVVLVVVAASTVLEIGIINVSQAQVTPSPTSPLPTNTTVSPALKAKICDPNNPKLAFVNTTESHICGIPKTPLAITVNSTTPTPSSPNPITPPTKNAPLETPIPGLP